MKSTVSSQQCAVTAFGEGFDFTVLQEGQSGMISWIWHVTEKKSARVSLNIVLYIFRHSDPTNLPYGILCMDRRITYKYGSRGHSNLFKPKPNMHSFYRV